MSELTLLQKAMRVVEEHEPSLFDVRSAGIFSCGLKSTKLSN
jgi:hypothetical protein